MEKCGFKVDKSCSEIIYVINLKFSLIATEILPVKFPLDKTQELNSHEFILNVLPLNRGTY